MGKGNRNRLDRMGAETEPKKSAPKAKKAHKPLGKTAKVTIACVLAVLIVGGIVVGALWNNGAFRSRTPLVKSTTGEYNLTKASATYLLWESQINYMLNLYSQWGILNESNASGYYSSALTNYRSAFATEEAVTKALNQSKDALTGYVAVCDIAGTLDVSLTKEEIKTAKENALSALNTWMTIAEQTALSNLQSGSTGSGDSAKAYTQKDYHNDSCSSVNEFLKKYVSPGITKQDVTDAAVIAALYNKALTEKNDRIEESLIENGVMNAEELAKYRDNNKADFFSTDYLRYVTEDTDLIESLKAISAEDPDEKIKEAKKLIATAVAEKSYTALFNKYAEGANAEATALYNQIKEGNQFTKDILNGYGLTYYEKTASDDIDVEKVRTWITDSSRKANDLETIAVSDNGIYVAVFIKKDTQDSKDVYTYALKKCKLVDAPDAFKGDDSFKANLIQSILVNLKLADGEEVYKTGDTADGKEGDEKDRITTANSILADMKSEVNTALTIKNDKYKAEDLKDDQDQRDEYLQWMFGTEEGDKKADPAADADAKIIEETTGEGDEKKTTYTYYMVVESMKLDDDDAIWGGYLKFTGDETTRLKLAKEAEEKLYKDGKQLTGVELWHALQELGASVDYGFESSDLSSMTALSDWLFGDGRTNSTMAIVSGKEKESSSSSSSASTAEIDVTYLAVLIEQTECWKATAFSALISEERDNWLEECRKGYDLNYDIVEKVTETTASAD